MKARCLVATALLLCVCVPASAQTAMRAIVVVTCGAQGYPLGTNVSPSYGPLTMLANGNLCISSSGGGGGGSVMQGTSPWVDNVTQFGGSNVVTGTGVSGPGIPRVTVSSDSFPATQAVSWTGQTVAATQSGTWNMSVSNFPTTQTVAGTVTANLGTLNGAALDTSVQAVKTTLGSPFQAGGSIGNTAFGISGSLPAGSAIIGKVGIDQTTPGTTNKVSIGTDGTVTTLPGACTTTQTIASGTSGTLIAANTARKSLRFMNIGTSDITVAPGTSAPTVGQGMVYANVGAGKQGGSETFNDTAVATNAFSFAAAATATVAVWECQ